MKVIQVKQITISLKTHRVQVINCSVLSRNTNQEHDQDITLPKIIKSTNDNMRCQDMEKGLHILTFGECKLV